MPATYKTVIALYAETFKSIDDKGAGKSKNNTILMGSYVELLNEQDNNWQKIKAFGIEGWIDKNKLGDSPGFKCFYVDVGQGDGALIEVGGSNGLKILIDGGPSDNLSRYLSKWQYKYYLNKGETVHFDYVFISHFDKDHYQGLIDIINDEHYTFGTIFHNGIAKFNKDKENFPEQYNTGLGVKKKEGKAYYLTTIFDSIKEFNDLKNVGGMLDLQEKFVSAVANASKQGRLKQFKRLDYKGKTIEHNINNLDFTIDVLGPVTSELNDGTTAFKWFDDDAHTINGHSIVIKITYGNRTFLFGGDLNIPAEEHLIAHYGNKNPFEVDVAKSCHHGASEFTTDFMEKVNALATVISSGDNESYSHPRADAIGCAGKYSRSKRPLVFSTELARSSNVKTDEVKYGMINLRCDGDRIIMAQMKEAATSGKVWDLYEEELNP